MTDVLLDIFSLSLIDKTDEQVKEIAKEFAKTCKSIPRFRDAFINKDNKLVIYTRTGGGNRAYYESRKAGVNDEHTGMFNEDLRNFEGFISDHNDPFDSTFAHFIYEPKGKAMKAIMDVLPPEEYQSEDPHVKMKNLLEAIKQNDTSHPSFQKAMEVGKSLVGQIENAVKSGNQVSVIET